MPLKSESAIPESDIPMINMQAELVFPQNDLMSKVPPLTEILAKLDEVKTHPPEGEAETARTQNILRLLVFKCANRVCEFEFPIFDEGMKNSIAYCPKCGGVILHAKGVLKVTIRV